MEKTKKEKLIEDINNGMDYANECIEDYEFASDSLDDFHRGMLAAYKAVLRSIQMIDNREY